MHITFREKPFLIKIDWIKNIAVIVCDADNYIYTYDLNADMDSFRFHFNERFVPDHDWEDEPIKLIEAEGFDGKIDDEIMEFLNKFLKGA